MSEQAIPSFTLLFAQKIKQKKVADINAKVSRSILVCLNLFESTDKYYYIAITVSGDSVNKIAINSRDVSSNDNALSSLSMQPVVTCMHYRRLCTISALTQQVVLRLAIDRRN